MKQVKYRVTHAIANYSRGDIIDAFLYIEGCDNEVILFHSDEDGFDHSLEIAHKELDGIYESKGYDTWINLTKESAKKILGEMI